MFYALKYCKGKEWFTWAICMKEQLTTMQVALELEFGKDNTEVKELVWTDTS